MSSTMLYTEVCEPGEDTFGRPLGIAVRSGVNLADEIIRAGHGRPR